MLWALHTLAHRQDILVHVPGFRVLGLVGETIRQMLFRGQRLRMRVAERMAANIGHRVWGLL